MEPSAICVARLFRARGAVQIEVNEQATLKARARFGTPIEGESLVVGRFLSPISLYRVFDGEELRNILDTGEVRGGDYSVPAEREFGAQWGSDRTEVAKWGDHERGQRLGHELFMAEIDGQGKVFAHLHVPGVSPDVGKTSIPANLCSTGLGCSVHVGVGEVRAWYTVGKGGSVRKTTLDALRKRAPRLGLKPRKHNLWLGALVHAPPKLAKGLSAWLQLKALPREDRDLPVEQRVEQFNLRRRLERDLLPDEKAARQLLQLACKTEDCGTWTAHHTSARRDAAPERADRSGKWQRHFAVQLWIKAEVAAPHYIATPTKARFVGVDVYDPSTSRWRRLWNSMGGLKVMFRDGRPRFGR